MKLYLIAAALLAAIPAAAQAQHTDHGAHAPSTDAFMSANEAMAKGMTMPMTGDPDRDFVTMMIAHHQGAIDMAKVELRYGKDPELRELAEDIVDAQEKEIAQMKAWLERHPH
jgi:uncharacterized protein (DUF305 family)